ncbi:tetratricopeptide repeat protein [Plantactinospora solaniradicis]|uniref:Tetratricopeptide repeat protein n=1 Tax=Plantactinospora solaniradicis TaxID=1723736 RepID=A0ABW1JZZ7_9ACTN
MAERLWVNRNEGIISTGPYAINTISNVSPPPISEPEDVPAPAGLFQLRQASATAALFVGREDELAEVTATLEHEHGVITQAITGLGGIGKSTLAERYALTHRERYTPIWWITAEGAAQINAGLAALARRLQPELGAHPDTSAHEWCLAWLDAHDGWLLILDNVTRPADVAELIGNHPRGRFLVTSRQTNGWTGIAIPTKLDILSAEQARELLGRLVADDRLLDDADELCTALGGLPLAIEIAAAYLTQNRITARDYLGRLTRPGDNVWSWVPTGGEPQRTVGRVWEVTFDRIADEHGPLPGLLLRALAWFASDDIPLSLLSCALPPDERHTPEPVDEAVGRLTAYGLVVRDDDGVAVHRLVQAVNRTDGPDATGVNADGCRRAIDALHLAWKDCDDWEERERLGPHLEAAVRHAAQFRHEPTMLALRTGVADHLVELGQRERDWGQRAIGLLEAILTDQRQVLDPDHPDILSTRTAHALAHVHARDAETGVALLETIVADGLRSVGPRHPLTVLARLHLAYSHAQVGEWHKTTTLLRRTIPDAERTVGPDHEYTVSLRYALAEFYAEDVRRRVRSGRGPVRAMRNFLAAQSLYWKVVESLERIQGPNAPATLQIVNELAEFCHLAGRPSEAARLYAHLHAAYEQELGPDAPDTEDALNALAETYKHTRRPERAIPLYEQIATAVEQCLGPGSPRHLDALDDLAEAYLAADNGAEAAVVYERALALRETRTGPDDPRTVSYLAKVAEAFEVAGLPALAIGWYERLVAARDRATPVDEQERLRARNNLAVVYGRADKRDLALNILDDIVPRYRSVFGEDDPETRIVERNLQDISEVPRTGRRFLRRRSR